MDNKAEKEHLIGYDEYDQTASKEPVKRKRRQLLSLLGILVLIIVIVAISLVSYLSTRTDTEEKQTERMQRGDKEKTDSYIAASGTTAIGMDMVIFDIDFLEDTTLCIEEVYLASGDEADEETKILKLTQESLEEARQELTETLQSAKLSYESSLITTQESRISKKYEYEKTMMEAAQAQSLYDDTMTALEAELEETFEKYQEVLKNYEELQNQILNNTFYDDYEVGEKKQAYTEAVELYDERYAYWEITEEELSSGDSSDSMVSSEAGMTMQAGMGIGNRMNAEEQAVEQDRKWIVKTMQLLEKEVESAEEAYEQAEESYEKAMESAELDFKLLGNELEKAQNEYQQMQLKYQQDMLSAKTTYETTMAKSKIAETEYETELESLSEELEKLKDARDEAQENLSQFETIIGDGYLYTEEKGTILKLFVQEEQELSGDDMIMAYSKPDEISVTVSVGQDDIAQIAVNDTVHIYIDGYDTYEGTVSSINPISSSSSKTSVNYTVIVSVSGDVSDLSENLTATVIFGNMEMPTGMEMPSDMEMPAGMEMPSDMEMPVGMEMPSGMEMPTGMEIPSDMTGKKSMGEMQHE